MADVTRLKRDIQSRDLAAHAPGGPEFEFWREGLTRLRFGVIPYYVFSQYTAPFTVRS
jgi:hypothetical protein